MLHRPDYQITLDRRGGLADDDDKLGLLFSTAIGICACAENSVGLWKFFHEPYSSLQTLMMVKIAKQVLAQQSIWPELPTLDLEIDNDPVEVPLVLGLAQLEKNQLVASKYSRNKVLTTLPMDSICELNRHLARTPEIFA